MIELTGRQGLVASFELHGTVVGVCRWCRRPAKRQRSAPFICTAYRTDPQEVSETKQEAGQARSRLLSDRQPLSQSQRQRPRAGRLIRRTEEPAQPEATQQPPSRLLQRSKAIQTTSQGLTRSTDTLRRTRSGNEKASQTAKQSNDRTKPRSPRSNGSTNTRFSQEAGKLSQKDWQVQSSTFLDLAPRACLPVPHAL